MPERFVSEPLKPVSETCDPARMATGEPGLPQQFIWRGQIIKIVAVLSSWKQTGSCRHGSPELYVRKHWYEVKTVDGRIMKIYFDRQPRRGHTSAARWWLFSIRDADQNKEG